MTFGLWNILFDDWGTAANDLIQLGSDAVEMAQQGVSEMIQPLREAGDAAFDPATGTTVARSLERETTAQRIAQARLRNAQRQGRLTTEEELLGQDEPAAVELQPPERPDLAATHGSVRGHARVRVRAGPTTRHPPTQDEGTAQPALLLLVH